MEDELFEQRTDLTKLSAAVEQIKATLGKIIVGQQDAIELLIAGILADGHVLLDDLPGVAKTLMARSFATASGLTFRRIQFTPDLLPADITGATLLDQRNQTFTFHRGPLFAQLVVVRYLNISSRAMTSIGLCAALVCCVTFLLSAGRPGKRSALPHARIMIHQPSQGGGGGTASDIEIQAKEILHLRAQMNKLMAKHTGQPVERIERDTDRDRFMSAEEAKEYGLIDNVISYRGEMEEALKQGEALKQA